MKNAFTLAETLITLMIIGLIAAWMYPALIKAAPDENALQYRKAFYSLEDVIRSLANDSTKYDDPEAMFKATPRDAADGSTDAYREVFCRNIANSMNTLGAINCERGRTLTDKALENISDENMNFKLTNGMSFGNFTAQFKDEDSDNLTPDTLTICVDVNGLEKGPNKGCASADKEIKNRDQYRIRIQFDGKVLTGEDKGSDHWNEETKILESRRITKEQKKRGLSN